MADDARGGTRTYENDEIRVIWRPDLCAHSGVWVRGLADVFRPGQRPWIDLGAAASDPIAAQIEQCPSGALSWERVRPSRADVPESGP
ncbi:MAG TPA: (4Fe-4S)-binding protein [Methylomirabilota bacterium]|jgi:uncharacterized Fe-S cluster protein YjdI|nr:(4Fe-4S)-binding protein [Methylomirabilota bacterium]